MSVRYSLILVAGGLCAIWFAACNKQDEITRYTVVNHPASKDRMLAAIIPQGERTWFFKLTGPDEAVASEAETFAQFVQSIRFQGGEESSPEWRLPEGWTEQPGSGMRFATVRIDSDGQPLELTVIPLPSTGQDPQQYLVSNINRWRRQLGLPAASEAEMFGESASKETVRQIAVDGRTITLVNLVGHLESGGMSGAPFASGGGLSSRAPFASDAPVATVGAGGNEPSEFTYDVPDGWTRGRVNSVLKAAFEVQDGQQQVKITVVALPPSGGDRLANINRWRKEVALPPISSEELDQHLDPIPVGQLTGDYVELISPADASQRKSILGAIVNHAGQAWFFTLKGDAELAQREKQRFRDFVQSVNFSKADGAGNGK